ncbi:MAG: hypothetical protein HY370_09475 [Proteobacteria bacterium]|nr:hypothetical protein [Pseudomonadota bacterium]
MRKFLLSLMMLVMLTPGMACGMAFCAHEAQAAAGDGNEMPCHDAGGKSGAGGVMLQNDCAKADLSTADDAAQVGKPDLSAGFHIAWADAPVEPHGILKSSSAVIRGPPLFNAAAASWPPVFLTTLRIRQ